MAERKQKMLICSLTKKDLSKAADIAQTELEQDLYFGTVSVKIPEHWCWHTLPD